MQLPIYLDYSATTPVDPRVAEKMSACLSVEGNFGNPASRSHQFGWKAEEAVENARREVADLIHADPREIVWTSGATESDNLAIKGSALFNQRKGKHIVTSKIEHKAVLDTCRQLERQGFEVTYLDPDSNGLTSPEVVKNALREDTTLVSIMHANNEIGVINDIAAIGAVTRANGVVFHVDGAQSTGKIPVDVEAMQIDLFSMSAHKMYGPQGYGRAVRAAQAAGPAGSPDSWWRPRARYAFRHPGDPSDCRHGGSSRHCQPGDGGGSSAADAPAPAFLECDHRY